MDYTTGVMRWSETMEAHYGLEPGSFGGHHGGVDRADPSGRSRVRADDLPDGDEDRQRFHHGVRRSGRTHGPVAERCRRALLGSTAGRCARLGRIVQGMSPRGASGGQYQQAQKMEAVGRLAGGVAHDFNNMLTVILGYCDLVTADLEAGDRRGEDVAEIQKAGQRAAGLTRQLLAFSRQQIIAPTLLDLNRIVEDFRAMLERLIGEDVRVVLALAPALGLVKATRTGRDCRNLAVNARERGEGRNVTIETVNVELTAQQRQTRLASRPPPLRLTVSDPAPVDRICPGRAC